MDPETTAEGGQVGVAGSDAASLADRHADDVAALHRVASLAPGDPDERLAQLLAAGCRALGVGRGFVLLRNPAGLTVRVVAGPEAIGPAAGDTDDLRLTGASAATALTNLIGTASAIIAGDQATAPQSEIDRLFGG